VPRSCTICEHPDREAIDRALVGDSSNLSISSLFGVSESAVRRHKANHLPAKLVMAQAAEEIAQADDLLGQMQDLQARTLAVLEAAESTNQHRTALSAIREARSNLELLAKLLGELDERPHVNVLISPTVQTAIIAALGPYPEARLAVADALQGLEDGAA
jgi:hypothetical protein